MADKAYSSRANRAYLRRRGIQTVIPVKEDQKQHRRNRGSTGGRPPSFDAERYKEPNTVRQQAQGLPGRGYPLRQERPCLPGRHRRRIYPDMAA
jgi:hypothetical protein